MDTKNAPSTQMEVNNYGKDNHQDYIEMGPKMSLDQFDEEYEYMKMTRPAENQGDGKLDIEWLHHRTSGAPFRNRFRSTVFGKHSYTRLRPGSDAILHMSRIEFNELSSCEVRHLNQFETADIIRIGLAVLHAWLSRE